MNNTVSIAFCFNDSFCLLAAGAISSLIRHTSEKYQYDIYIVQDDISEINKYLINSLNQKENINIRFIEIDHKNYTNEDLDYRPIVTKHTFSRLFLHKLLPELDRIVYLDSDIIVKSDIAELYFQDLEGHAIGACQDPLLGDYDKLNYRFTAMPEYNIKTNYDYLRYLGFNDEEMGSYCNAGVLLLDLKLAGRELDKELPKLLKSKYVYADQDILNIVFKGKRRTLDRKFNVSASRIFEYVSENKQYPVIIHYTWIKPTVNMSKRMAFCYWEEMSQTKFYYAALENFIDQRVNGMAKSVDKKMLDIRNAIHKELQAGKTLDDLYSNLKRLKRSRLKRRYIRAIIKLLVNRKRYRKLKSDPARFFADSQSKFIRFLGRHYD